MRGMTSAEVRAAAAVLGKARRVVAFTGAGVSAESGVPTFRGTEGLWEGWPVAEVASPRGFYADPRKVWRFYEERRANLLRVGPNPAHHTLARWQRRFGSFVLATQNVDGLHQAAGSTEVMELHGSIWTIRCSNCERERVDRTAPLPELPPRCVECCGLERPGVVWFGEQLPSDVIESAVAAVTACDVLLVVGTSAVVYPAAGLVEMAARAGATVVEVNPEASALAHLASVALRGPAGVLLPQVDALLEEP
jgi:NAD-dependent deacetylase